MSVHKIKKGLDLPIAGKPTQQISAGPTVRRVAVMADDFPGMKPGLEVQVGDHVRRGQVLLRDRRRGEVAHTAPGAGTVVAVNRGARRALLSVVIELTESEREGRPADDDHQPFESYTGSDPDSLDAGQIRALLLESGLWAALRQRPFSKVPTPDAEAPHSIFVTAADTHPLTADPDVVLKDQRGDFDQGLRLIAKLTEGTTYLCVAKGSAVPQGLSAPVQVEEFAGPHPAGTAGLHIHTLAPVSRSRTVWWIGYQDVANVGRLFRTGRLAVDRVVALGGPPLKDPKLVRTRVGASTHDLLAAEEPDLDDVRYVSGSVLSGKKAMGEVYGFMGRYDNQVSVIREDREREFIGWLSPGAKKFSTLPIYLSWILRPKEMDLSTNTNGSERAIIPIGTYEAVMPFDLVTTYLLRSLAVGDIETAEQLGCLELDEEDLALCTFVDPGKNDFGPILRKNLEIIEKEG
jgi:Na+-transporting NADH:ubiquinone oxidoreductase subunit A